jgi:excisionase family DNA binding protein
MQEQSLADQFVAIFAAAGVDVERLLRTQAIMRTPSGVPILSLSVDDASASTGISRSKLYEWIKAGRLVARKADGRTLIESAELARVVSALPSSEPISAAAS